jgi:hypothetical protein
MQKLRLAQLTLFAIGLLYVLHEHAQTGRFVSNPDGSFVTDTQTGAVYTAAQARGGTQALYAQPIR